ncbi:hypothetical protein [Acetomicrobium thermoterrenum]|uniref:hypothetical protein n=1 Tax=Acetomicrobium thermoterrenum TaxID=1120986 RepID=UPI000B82055A|nr:hypothetical protein [Acetomicrobium thermoterrenum]
MRVWEGSTTKDRDRKELLRTLLEEVNITLGKGNSQVHLIMRWRGRAVSELDLPIKRHHQASICTDEILSSLSVVWMFITPMASSQANGKKQIEKQRPGKLFSSFLVFKEI